jgi:phosphate transport system substrate-binding protein
MVGMKKIISIICVCSLIFILVGAAKHQKNAKAEAALSGTISLSGAWALYPMGVRWADEFKKLHPDVKFDVSAGGAGKGLSDAVAGIVDIGMVSREVTPAELEKGAFPIAVTKDAVVPTMNGDNPFQDVILKKGIPQTAFVKMWIGNKENNVAWKTILPEISDAKATVGVYTRSDSCGAAETWAKYLGKKQEDLTGVGVYGDPGLAEAVRKDMLGVGFNNVNYAYDANSKREIKGLKVIPIDVNNNGVLDENEKMYATRDELTKAIADGRYPAPPARDLYFVTKGKPTSALVKKFIDWALTAGQKYVPEAGYINLTDAHLKEELKKVQ